MMTWKWMPGFYIKQSEWGKEQDSGETERECVRGSASLIMSLMKCTVGENIW
jgi:hypothetical protein